MENIKIMINIMINAIIIFVITFKTLGDKLSINLLLLLLIGIWLIILINYNINKNTQIIIKCMVISIIAYYVFIIINQNNILKLVSYDKYLEVYVTNPMVCILFIVGMYIFLQGFNNEIYIKSKCKLLKKETLFDVREKDLEQLENYLNKFKIVGINAKWGQGKSFITDKLKKKIELQYEVIEIDLLSCNLDEVQRLLIKEIESIMKRNGIISKYSNSLKKFFSNNNILDKINGLLFEKNNTYVEIINGFIEETNLIDKKVLIIYEDIDRISSNEVIKKIFSLSEKISDKSNKIKILYQYDERKLKEIGFEDDFLEKYIPYKLSLTQMSFFELIQLMIEKNKINAKILTSSDFYFFKNRVLLGRYSILEDKLNIHIEFNMNYFSFSIREVDHFILEIVTQIEKFNEDKETVIAFFFIKHFMPEVYNQLVIGKELIETFKFIVDEREFTIEQIVAVAQNTNDIENFNKKVEKAIKENLQSYVALKLFNYNYELLGIGQHEKKLNKLCTNDEKELISYNNNEKKNRIIWNLMQNGKSTLTDYQNIGKKFIKDVLDKDENTWKNEFIKFREEMVNLDKYNSEHETIFLYGVSEIIQLLKAFRILNESNENQEKLVKLYLKIKGNKNIDIEFIRHLNNCYFNNIHIYIKILGIINGMNIVYNFNDEQLFAQFLKKYVQALSLLSIIPVGQYYNILGVNKISEYKNNIVNEINEIIDRLRNIKDSIKLNCIVNDLGTIIEFFQKMKSVINCTESYKKEIIYKSNSLLHSETCNQEEYNRLIKYCNENDFDEKVKDSYERGKISIYEIKLLYEEINKIENEAKNESVN